MIIYKITNIVNNKVYIGLTKQVNPISRFNKHVSESKKEKCNYLHSAIKKYGKKNFVFDVLCSCSNITDLKYMEKFFIKQLSSNIREIGYNLTSGGECTILNKESVEKMKKKIQEQYQNGRTPWNIGLKYTSGIEPWNKGVTGYKLNSGINISKALLGLKKTEIYKKNLSESSIERFKLNKHVQSKNVECVQLNLIFKSANQAARYFNTSQGGISNVCRGERKSNKGLNFIYTEKEPNFIMLGKN